MQRLKDKLALVTGASAGIGLATARALAAEGARVVLAARRLDRIQAIAKELPGARAVALDVRDGPQVIAALGSDPYDIAVVNAGLGLGLGPLDQGSIEDWSTMIDTNVKGVLHTLKAVTPGMRARGRGDVVLLGSVAGRQSYPGGNVYCATKFAVRGIYESLRLDFAKVTPDVFQQRRLEYHKGIEEDFFGSFRVANTLEHKLKPGETLWLLSHKKYAVPGWLIRRYNPDVDLGKLVPGVVLVIPIVEKIG